MSRGKQRGETFFGKKMVKAAACLSLDLINHQSSAENYANSGLNVMNLKSSFLLFMSLFSLEGNPK
jgi:hypothetical protein